MIKNDLNDNNSIWEDYNQMGYFNDRIQFAINKITFKIEAELYLDWSYEDHGNGD